MNEEHKLLPVTQEDRDAADRHTRARENGGESLAEAFARHRLATRPIPSTEAEGLAGLVSRCTPRFMGAIVSGMGLRIRHFGTAERSAKEEARADFVLAQKLADAMPTILTALANTPQAEAGEPVAWRWRYVRSSGASHWTVRQSPIEPSPATKFSCAVEVEPLFRTPAWRCRGRCGMTYPKKLACPKCGEPGDQLTTYAYDNGGRHVECDRCFYLGPGERSILAAIRSHNEHCRAALSALTAGDYAGLVETEREACAKLVEDHGDARGRLDAAAIRARSIQDGGSD